MALVGPFHILWYPNHLETWHIVFDVVCVAPSLGAPSLTLRVEHHTHSVHFFKHRAPLFSVTCIASLSDSCVADIFSILI